MNSEIKEETLKPLKKELEAKKTTTEIGVDRTRETVGQAWSCHLPRAIKSLTIKRLRAYKSPGKSLEEFSGHQHKRLRTWEIRKSKRERAENTGRTKKES